MKPHLDCLMCDDLSSSIRSLVLEPTAISGLLSVTIIDHYGKIYLQIDNETKNLFVI